MEVRTFLNKLSERLERFSLLYLAHHDPEDCCFLEHVFKVGPLYLCLGCTSAILGLASWCTLDYYFNINLFFLFIITTFAIILALLQLKLKLRKYLKALFRYSIGIGIGSYISIIITIQSFLLQIFLILLLIAGTYTYTYLRQSRLKIQFNKIIEDDVNEKP